MRVPTQQIEQAAATKDIRKYMQHTYFDGKRLIASDGHILAIVRAKDVQADDTRGSVPAEILKAGRKSKLPADQIALNGSAKLASNGLTVARPDDGTYPNVAKVIRHNRKQKRAVKVRIDAELLLRLAKAITDADYIRRNGAHVTLEICDSDSSIFVRGSGADAGYGAIMPVRL